MSEQIHDQVSAFIDDELSSEECAFLVRRLERDPEARSKFIRYSLIGSALRSELLQPDPRTLSQRIGQALDGAPAPAPAKTAAAAHAPARQPKWVNPAFGVGIAASVAIAALFTVRTINDLGGGAQAPLSGPLQAETIEAPDVPSYVVPAEAPDNRVFSPPPVRLTNYLMHHGEYASRLSRTSVHSNVVGTADQPAADAAESEPQ
ncbi:MAG: sigma-E factor negative regulatory protein [Gammaproteobacteria bacterium]|nr:sigma-E factor negative regulatory protein [Gammaproteobacteria bacterium]